MPTTQRIRRRHEAVIAIGVVVSALLGSALWLGGAFAATATPGRAGAARPTASPEPRGLPLDDPELERRIEALKESLQAPEHTPQEVDEMLTTLWEWGNVHAIAGTAIPVDFPPDIAGSRRSLRTRASSPQELTAIVDGIRRYAYELALKEDAPDALGSLHLEPPAGPVRVGERVTLVQTWTVGSVPMKPGGGVILVLKGGQELQAKRPTQDGFVTMHTSRSAARLTLTEPWGEWLSFIVRRVLPFRLEGATLEPGDTVTITLGDRSQGGAGMTIQEWSNDQVTFPVLLDLDGDGIELTPAWPAVEVLGDDEVASVNAIAPSVVAAGQPFELAVRSEDRMENLASGGVPGWTVSLEGKVVARLSPGGAPLALVTDLRLDEPGVYRFAVDSEERGLRTLSNPILVEEAPERRIYWGETHGHSGFAEGQGSPDGYYRFGRDVARLDFLSLSEHDLWMDDAEWRSLQEMVAKYDDPGRFTAILGYEWTVTNRLGGHHNVFYPTAAGRRRTPNQEAPTLPDLYAGLRRINDPEEILIIPHAHQAGDWTQSDPVMERLVEITSGHGTFEFFGQKYLDNGFEVGFVGASDNHVGHPGYSGVRNRQLGGLAAVLATENTTASLFDSLRRRSTYATTGERILIDASFNGEPMGRRLSPSAERHVECRVMGTGLIESIDLVRNGTVLYRRSYLSSSLSSRQRVQVSFESSTEVFSDHRNPRGARPWLGWIEVEGARLVTWEEPWFTHPVRFMVTRTAGNDQRLDFAFDTRGRPKALILELEGATSATRLRVRLQAAREDNPSPGAADRPPASLPPADIDIRLDDLRFGPRTIDFEVVRNVDRIQLQLVPADGALDQSFEYTDLEGVRADEPAYYYLRVRQVDGAMAWSSPWWVGSEDGGR